MSLQKYGKKPLLYANSLFVSQMACKLICFSFNLCVTTCLQTRAACLYTQLHTLSLNKTEPCVYNSLAARAAALVCRLIVTWWNYTTDVSAQSWKKQIEQQTQQTPSGLFKVGGRFPVGEKRK